jgi:4'-phosphopantetheinyl transferase
VKASGRGFSAAPFKTFTIREKDATNSGVCPISSSFFEEALMQVRNVCKEIKII